MTTRDPDRDKIAQRHPKIEQDPLFEVPPGAAGTQPEKVKSEPSIRTAKCPSCCGKTSSNSKVGVIRISGPGGDLEVFRDHDKFTVGGRRIPCSGSGTEAPPDATSGRRGGWSP